MPKSPRNLLLIWLAALACRAPEFDGVAVIEAACEGRERDPGLKLPTTDELWSFVQQLEFPNLPYRVSPTYEAVSEADARRLATWWSTQNVAARVSARLPSTPEEVEAVLATGVTGLEIGCDTIWAVRVTTPPTVLTHEWTGTWVTTLESVPHDSAWVLAGWSFNGP